MRREIGPPHSSRWKYPRAGLVDWKDTVRSLDILVDRKDRPIFTVLLPAAFRKNELSKTASEIPCTTHEPGIEIKNRIHRDLRGRFDEMPSKISVGGVVCLFFCFVSTVRRR